MLEQEVILASKSVPEIPVEATSAPAGKEEYNATTTLAALYTEPPAEMTSEAPAGKEGYNATTALAALYKETKVRVDRGDITMAWLPIIKEKSPQGLTEEEFKRFAADIRGRGRQQ